MIILIVGTRCAFLEKFEIQPFPEFH